jgi:hypothetical protein
MSQYIAKTEIAVQSRIATTARRLRMASNHS